MQNLRILRRKWLQDCQTNGSLGTALTFSKHFTFNYKKRKEQVDLQISQNVIAQLQKLGFICFKDMFNHFLVAEILLNLDTLLCNSVPEPAEVSNNLLETVYEELQLRESMVVNSFTKLKADIFSMKCPLWCFVDGTKLHSLFEFTKLDKVVPAVKDGNKVRSY